MNALAEVFIRDIVRVVIGLLAFDFLLIYLLFKRDPNRKRQGKM